jgi:hypothetical protein
MAADSDAPARKKNFDLGHPGGKEYFIVGGVALGIGLVYFWWRSRTGAAAAAATTAASAPATPTGLNTSDFSSWVHDHQSSTTTTAGGDKDHAKKVTVPDVTGEKYPIASKKIAAEGLIAQRGSPYVGKVVRESPHAGTKVRHGSVVTLSGEPWPGSKGHAGKGGGEKHHCPEGSKWDAAKKRCVPDGPARGGGGGGGH